MHQEQGSGAADDWGRRSQDQLYRSQYRVGAGLEFHTAQLHSPRDQTDPGHPGTGQQGHQGMTEFMMDGANERQIVAHVEGSRWPERNCQETDHYSRQKFNQFSNHQKGDPADQNINCCRGKHIRLKKFHNILKFRQTEPPVRT